MITKVSIQRFYGNYPAGFPFVEGHDSADDRSTVVNEDQSRRERPHLRTMFILTGKHATFVLLAACLLMSAAVLAAKGADEHRDPTILGIDGYRFTLNGRATFLLGISYYAALGAPEEFIRRDLDEMKRLGFNWLRVWATWGAFDQNVSAVDEQGQPREASLAKLKWLLSEADRRGLVVDVTLTRGKSGTGHLHDFKSHERAVETVVTALKENRNWYLDLANERDVRDERYVSFAELKILRELARSLDSPLLVTASFGGRDLTEEDVHDALSVARLDFLSPHRPRNLESPTQTGARTREWLEMMKKLGRVAPIQYQEPFRRGYGSWEPVAADFLADLRGAREGGAAGWCFHNGQQRDAPGNFPRRSFDLREKRLFDQLDEEEQKVAAQCARSTE
jgi:hypothetical protein